MESSRPLATFTFGCMEEWNIQFVRRTIVHNGGRFMELYAPPGVSLDAEFRTWAGRQKAMQRIADWMNAAMPSDEPEEYLYTADDYATQHEFVVDHLRVKNYIGREAKTGRLRHPIKGGTIYDG